MWRSRKEAADLLLGLAARSRTLCVMVVSEDGRVIDANAAARLALANAPDGLVGELLERFLVGTWSRLRDRVGGAGGEPVLMNFRSASGGAGSMNVLAQRGAGEYVLVGEPAVADFGGEQAALMALNDEVVRVARERARERAEATRLNEQLRTTLDELESSYFHIRRIHEFIPVCMSCGRLKGKETQWSDLAEYLLENGILISHGYCPDCGDQLADGSDRGDHPVDTGGGEGR